MSHAADIKTRINQCLKHIEKVESLKTKACLNDPIALNECAEEFENFANRLISSLDYMAGGIIHFFKGNEKTYFPKKMKCRHLREHELFHVYGSKHEIITFFKEIKNNFNKIKIIGDFNNLSKHNFVIKAKNKSSISANGIVESLEIPGSKFTNCTFKNVGHIDGDQYDGNPDTLFEKAIGLPKNHPGVKNYKGDFQPVVSIASLIIENTKDQKTYELIDLMKESLSQLEFIFNEYNKYFTS